MAALSTSLTQNLLYLIWILKITFQMIASFLDLFYSLLIILDVSFVKFLSDLSSRLNFQTLPYPVKVMKSAAIT